MGPYAALREMAACFGERFAVATNDHGVVGKIFRGDLFSLGERMVEWKSESISF